jgi:ABC-type glycerol-3-phosphate transport system substrate-binding protein
MTRPRLALLLLAVLAFGVHALAQTTQLTMWVRTPETVDLLGQSIDRFHEANPDVRVRIVTFAADAYPGALQAAISGGDLPDAFQVHNSVPVPRLVSLGLIQPLEPHFSDDFRDRFDPATWWEGSTTVGGEIYAWPDRSFRRASLFLYYNRDVMRAAGLDPEAPPVTWSEFVDQANAVTEAGNGRVYGLHLGFTSGWFNERVILQLATTAADAHGVPAEHLPGRMVNWTTGELFDPSGIQEAVGFFADLMATDAVHPDFLNTGRSQATAQWAAGQAAFLFDGSWRLQELLRTEPDLDFGIAMLPSRDGGPVLWGVEGGSQNAFAVAARSPNAAAAARLFEWLSDDYYPLLIEGAVDLTPIPELNARDELFTSSAFRELVRLTEIGTIVLPSPVMENVEQLETIVRLAGKTGSRPFGESMQGFLAEGAFDVSAFLASYGTQQNAFLAESLDEARAEGADVDETDWVFPTWEPTVNHY